MLFRSSIEEGFHESSLLEFCLMTRMLIFPFPGRPPMWWPFAAAYWMLLFGPVYGCHKIGGITNPEATMNIVSCSLRKKK